MKTIEKLRKNGIFFNYDDMVRLCKKYCVTELSIFGSAIRNDFTQSSDVDILVSFEKDSKITLFDMVELEEKFSQLLNREADIVERESIRNPMRRHKILSTREIIYSCTSHTPPIQRSR